MKSSLDLNQTINRKKLANELAKKYDVSLDEIKRVIKAQTLLIERGMGTREDEWQEVYHPIRIPYVGLFRPTERRAKHVEKRMLEIATKEIQESLKAQKQLNDFLERNKNKSSPSL